MRCDVCQGSGFVAGLETELDVVEPCPACNGCGQGHCCDGLREQAEPDDDID
jgi:hypothetical protein